jgi:hypothetical protein
MVDSFQIMGEGMFMAETLFSRLECRKPLLRLAGTRINSIKGEDIMNGKENLDSRFTYKPTTFTRKPTGQNSFADITIRVICPQKGPANEKMASGTTAAALYSRNALPMSRDIF